MAPKHRREPRTLPTPSERAIVDEVLVDLNGVRADRVAHSNATCGLSRARVSQLRDAFRTDWRAFHDGSTRNDRRHAAGV